MDGVVAAVGRADRVGAAGVLGAGVEGVVRALLGRLPDRVHRGEVDDVEAHRGDGGEPLRRGAERAGGPAVLLLVVGRALAAREELVPGARQGELALDEQGQVGRGGHVLAQRPGGELLLDGGVGARLEPHGGGALGVAQAQDGVGEHGPLGRGAGHLGAGPLEHQGALLEHQRGVDVGLDLDRGVVLPGAVGVGPALDAVGPPAGVGALTRAAQVFRPGLVQVIGCTCSTPEGSVSTTEALTASWPSRKTVAVTSNSSSTTALAGRAPSSTLGLTSRTGMRPIGCWGARVRGAAVTRRTLPATGGTGHAARHPGSRTARS